MGATTLFGLGGLIAQTEALAATNNITLQDAQATANSNGLAPATATLQALMNACLGPQDAATGEYLQGGQVETVYSYEALTLGTSTQRAGGVAVNLQGNVLLWAAICSAVQGTSPYLGSSEDPEALLWQPIAGSTGYNGSTPWEFADVVTAAMAWVDAWAQTNNGGVNPIYPGGAAGFWNWENGGPTIGSVAAAITSIGGALPIVGGLVSAGGKIISSTNLLGPQSFSAPITILPLGDGQGNGTLASTAQSAASAISGTTILLVAGVLLLIVVIA